MSARSVVVGVGGRLALGLTLSWAWTPASWGQEPSLAAPVAADPSVEEDIPAATVLEDRLEVRIDGAGKVTEKRTWRVRVDDPSKCRAGLLAPDGMDGARDGVAQVFERLLVPPEGTPAGSTFTLVSTRTATASAHSGVFETAPDLPVVQASVSITSAQPNLTVWSDARGKATFNRANGRSATISWEGLDVGMSGQVVWTTWRDWLQAGDKLEESVAVKLVTTREALGKDLAADVQTLSPATAAERVFQHIALEEGGNERWEASRKVSAILESRRGTAVERGVVLISLLRVRGFDARPALYRPAASSGSAPLSVPAPALITRPAVAVYLPGRTIWIDPGSSRVAIPEMPASMIGSAVWVAGDSPFQLPNPGLVDGTVAINARSTVDPHGGATLAATISANGAGAEALRTLLGSLPPAERETVLRKLFAVANPSVDRFSMEAQGLEDPYRPLQITVQGHVPDAFAPFAGGLRGDVHPVLAPSLAAWLPARIQVHEDLSVSPPSGLEVVASAPVPAAFHPDVLLSRRFRREAGRLVMATTAERPVRGMSPGRDADTERFLHDQAPKGPVVLVIPPPTPEVVKAVRTAQGRPPAEVAILEALLWWTHNGKPKSAEKAFRRALALSAPGDVAPMLSSLSAYDEPRGWIALYDNARTDQERMQAVAGLAAQGRTRDAWVRAVQAAGSPDPVARARALVWWARLEGPPPSPEDKEAVAMWKPPGELLDEASRSVPPEAVVEVAVARAELAIAEGRLTDAEALLEQALAPGTEPRAAALLAVVGAQTGVAQEDVMERIMEALSQAPDDDQVLRFAARAASIVGDRDRALLYTLSAARLVDGDAALWGDAADAAVLAGDLAIGVQAARRASDLAPADKARGARLAMLATLAGNQEAAMVGASRSGVTPDVKWPPTVDTLVGLAPDDALLALLQYHDAEVVASPQNLSLRAQLRLDAGRLDGAARDGALLAARHGNARGTAISFAATAGRLWSSAQVDALDAAAKLDPVAYAVRMEYRLVSGTGDASVDAKAQKDDPRAQMVVRAGAAPDALAKEVAGWKGEAADPTIKAPSAQFKPNKLLGGAKGVVAWSDPERARAVVVSAEVTGSLPPPLGNLYTPAARPLRRLTGGGQLVRLEGGPIPLYAATRIVDGLEYTGVAFTPEAALDALLLAVP